jgi:hypothetical protein
MKLTSGLLALIAAVISYVVWQRRQAQAAVRLREIDEGKRCIACNGTELHQSGGVAMCARCGHKVSLAVLQAASVSTSEIANVTKPPENRGLL